MRATSDRWLFAAAAILAFALRFGYAAATGALQRPQFWEQEQIATNLLEGRGFLFESRWGTYRSYSEPMYPFLAALVYFVTRHSRTALVLVQLVIASLTVWVGGRMAMDAANDRATGVVAALLLAFHPGLIHYSSILHPFVLDVFFFTAAGGALVLYRQQPTLARGCAAAALVGLGALTRPTILVFLLPMAWIAWRSSALPRAALMVAVALLFVLPWTLRNAVVQHQFMLTRSGSGFVFWLGNNPATSGSAGDLERHPLIDTTPPEFRQRILAADETTRDRIFLDAAWQYIQKDPPSAARRICQRLAHFWWFSPQWGAHYSSLKKLIYRGWWLTLLPFVVIGLAGLRQKDLLLLAALALLLSLVQSLYYVEGRHRLAVEPLIIPAAGAGVMFVWRKILALSKRDQIQAEAGQAN